MKSLQGNLGVNVDITGEKEPPMIKSIGAGAVESFNKLKPKLAGS